MLVVGSLLQHADYSPKEEPDMHSTLGQNFPVMNKLCRESNLCMSTILYVGVGSLSNLQFFQGSALFSILIVISNS